MSFNNLPADCGKSCRYLQEASRPARGEIRCAIGLEWAPLVRTSDQAVDPHLRLRRHNGSAK